MRAQLGEEGTAQVERHSTTRTHHLSGRHAAAGGARLARRDVHAAALVLVASARLGCSCAGGVAREVRRRRGAAHGPVPHGVGSVRPDAELLAAANLQALAGPQELDGRHRGRRRAVPPRRLRFRFHDALVTLPLAHLIYLLSRCEIATLTQSLLRRACKLAARRRVEQTNPGEVLGRVGSIAPARDAASTQSSGLGRSLHGSRIAPLHFIY